MPNYQKELRRIYAKTNPKVLESHLAHRGYRRTLSARIKQSKSIKGENHWHWKDGKTKHTSGYINVYNPTNSFGGSQTYILEHRLVIESQIGRFLTKEEAVHHLNEIRDDNRPENLMAFTSESAHQRFHWNPNNVKPEEIIFDGRKLFNNE